uniref:Mitotic spindle assembly checkpoint protein MAD1 n=1 Tax=Neolamprologus brichardi TaxID=32507 RepID=A0A3Q4MFE3_NEOBR
MDLEDDTTILTTLKSFNSFISRPEHPQRLSEHSAGSGILQSQYKRSMELLEAAERVHSKNRYLQLDQEKKQMELSHKRARFELEKAASDSARDLEHEVDRNQELLTQIKKLEERAEERQRLEEQNNILEMRLERHNLQGDYDPVKTRVLHLKVNPTAIAKQERQQEVEALRQEVTRLRDLVRSLQSGGAVGHSQDDTHNPSFSLSLAPSKEVLDLRKQMESSELRNQRLKEVFQRKIQEFRTVCYVLTGYQIDITTENQYRLTSVYAEHMDDSLLFKKSGPAGPGSNGSMQLMETEFSKTLGEMVALHLHHQKSIPAFLSAVTLDLFSRQTTV